MTARTEKEALSRATTARIRNGIQGLTARGFVRLVSIPGAVMYGHDDGRCASINTDGEVKHYATREQMARELLGG